MPYSGAGPAKTWALNKYEGDLLTSGEETYPRRLVLTSVTMSTNILRLAFFTARKTDTYTQLRACSSTAAGATPTLVKFGIFSVASNGDLTCIAVTANDTSVFAGANSEYTRATTASFSLTAGQRYAFGVLVVTGASAPTVTAGVTGLVANTAVRAPALTGVINPAADFPAVASVTPAASVGPTSSTIYGEVVP